MRGTAHLWCGGRGIEYTVSLTIVPCTLLSCYDKHLTPLQLPAVYLICFTVCHMQSYFPCLRPVLSEKFSKASFPPCSIKIWNHYFIGVTGGPLIVVIICIEYSSKSQTGGKQTFQYMGNYIFTSIVKFLHIYLCIYEFL